MSNILYNKRTWLNPPDSHFTGSMVCFDGIDVVNQGKQLDRYTFVEIASCHGKVRLHNDQNLPPEEFIIKLKEVKKQLVDFIHHLEGQL